MKKNITIVFIGAASAKRNNKIFGGQIPDISNIINENTVFMAIDPDHSKESDEFLEKCAGVPIYRSNCATAINLKSLNVFDKYASEVFEDMVASEDTFYLVFSFTGIEKEAPSFDIARRLEIKNRFYWDLENSLFLGMGCLCKRFDLFNLLKSLEISTNGFFDPKFLKLRLQKLVHYQNEYYAFQNNIDGLTRAYQMDMMPEWGPRSMRKLRHIGIYNIEEAFNFYQNMKNDKNIGIQRLITSELTKLDIINFWDERPNDFFSS